MIHSDPDACYTNVFVKNTFLVIADVDADQAGSYSSALRMRSCPPVVCRHKAQVDATSEVDGAFEVDSEDEEPRYHTYEALMSMLSNTQDSPLAFGRSLLHEGASPCHYVDAPKHEMVSNIHDEMVDNHINAADDTDLPITTMMIRNIPCRCTKESILQDIDGMGFHGTYDFFYLPSDRRRKSNLGYAFINFKFPGAAAHFQTTCSGFKFSSNPRICNSQKVCCITPATIQGLENNKNHFSRVSSAKVFNKDHCFWVEDGTELMMDSRHQGNLPDRLPNHVNSNINDWSLGRPYMMDLVTSDTYERSPGYSALRGLDMID